MIHRFLRYNIPRPLHYLIFAVFFLMLLSCSGDHSIKKLGNYYLKGNFTYFNYHKFKGDVLSVNTESISSSQLPVFEDSLSLNEFIDGRLQQLSSNPIKSVTTFLPNGKLMYVSIPLGQDTKYSYDKNGYLVEESLLGGKTKRLYYKKIFKYNQDTTSCISENYKMKKIKNFEYGQGLDYKVVDSLNTYGPDTTDYLYEKTEYMMNENGLKMKSIKYGDEGTRVERKTITEYYNDDKLQITYTYLMSKYVKRAWITRSDLNKNREAVKFEEYYLNDMNELEGNFDFTNNYLIDINLEDKEVFRLDKIEKFIFDGEGDRLEEKDDIYTSLLDENGNWYAKVLFDSRKKEVVKKIEIRDIIYRSQ